jgi:hypothetical protein
MRDRYVNDPGAANMMRNVLSVFVGAIAWMAAFYAFMFATAAAWPDFQVHGRAWTQQGVFSFTPLMACFNLIYWLLAAIAAGFVAKKIATHREAVWVLAGLIVLYLASLHFMLMWSTFPWWYNLGVVVPAAPAILVGAKLAGISRDSNSTVAAG